MDNLLDRLLCAAPAAEAATAKDGNSSGGSAGGGSGGGGSGGGGGGGGGFRRVKAVRVGHPARQSPRVLAHSLEAHIARADGTEVVNGIRDEIRGLHRSLYGSGGGGGGGGGAGAQKKGKNKGAGSGGGGGVSEAAGGRRGNKEQKAKPSERYAMRRRARELQKEVRSREQRVFGELLRSCNVSHDEPMVTMTGEKSKQ